MNVIKHLETHIGKIEKGYIDQERQNRISVSTFSDQPFNDLKTYSTLGLNRYNLGYKSFFELLFVCHKSYNAEKTSSFLSHFADYLINNRYYLLRGDVIPLPRKIIDSSDMDCLYISLPFYFDTDIQVLHTEDRNIVFPLLIPIYSSEAKIIEQKGWDSFEDFLSKIEADNLWDLNRAPYVW